jgi:microcystin-dependent protein
MSIFTHVPATWTADLPVPNAATFNLEIKEKMTDIDAKFPTGIIVLWSGAVAAVPSGWYLCNGANGTPDLRDRFVVGAGSSYAVAANGGEATHILTTPEMPAHTHVITDTLVKDGLTAWRGTNAAIGITQATGSTGGGGAHENRPPYYALAYIMKS